MRLYTLIVLKTLTRKRRHSPAWSSFPAFRGTTTPTPRQKNIFWHAFQSRKYIWAQSQRHQQRKRDVGSLFRPSAPNAAASLRREEGEAPPCNGAHLSPRPIHPAYGSLRSLAAVSHNSRAARLHLFIITPAFQFIHSFISSVRQADNSSSTFVSCGFNFSLPRGLFRVHLATLQCECGRMFVRLCCSCELRTFTSFRSQTAETGSSEPRGVGAGCADIDGRWMDVPKAASVLSTFQAFVLISTLLVPAGELLVFWRKEAKRIRAREKQHWAKNEKITWENNSVDKTRRVIKPNGRCDKMKQQCARVGKLNCKRENEVRWKCARESECAF